MVELQFQHPFSLPPPPLPPLHPPDEPPAQPPPSFDPSRMIGIIKRKALIKDLAAAYHAECLTCCQELSELQKKLNEQPFADFKAPEEPRKELLRPSKRMKKTR